MIWNYCGSTARKGAEKVYPHTSWFSREVLYLSMFFPGSTVLKYVFQVSVLFFSINIFEYL